MTDGVSVTAGGSSGSPLLDAASRLVVGQLHCGSAECGSPYYDYFGALSYTLGAAISGFADHLGGGAAVCPPRDFGANATAFPTLAPSYSAQPTVLCIEGDGAATDPYGDGCAAYHANPSWCGGYDDDDFTSASMCCACGGGSDTRSPSASPTLTVAPSMTASPTSLVACYETCFGYTCEYWMGHGYSCEVLEVSYGCGCSGCDCEAYGVVDDGCVDTEDGATDSFGDSCADYVSYPSWCGGYDDGDFSSTSMCCACGGGTDMQSPTSSPTMSVAPSLTASPTVLHSCYETCFGYTCEYWIYEGYSCDTLESTYACDCSGCDCDAYGFGYGYGGAADDGCADTDNGAADPYGDGCADYYYYPSWCGGYDDSDFSSTSMCCACGGGATVWPPTGDPTPRPSFPHSNPNRPSAEPSWWPSSEPSAEPAERPSPQPLVQPPSEPSNEPSLRPSAHPATNPALRPSSSPSLRPSAVPTVAPTVTFTIDVSLRMAGMECSDCAFCFCRPVGRSCAATVTVTEPASVLSAA